MHPLLAFSRAGRCFSQRLCILYSLFLGLEDAFRNAYASYTRFFLGWKMHFATPMHPLLAFSRAGRYISRLLCILYLFFLGLEDTFRDAYASSARLFSGLKIHFARPMHPLFTFSRAGRCISRLLCILYSLFLEFEDAFRDSYVSSTCFFSGWKMLFATPMYPPLAFSWAGRCILVANCISRP